jgi:hypothetical protein
MKRGGSWRGASSPDLLKKSNSFLSLPPI